MRMVKESQRYLKILKKKKKIAIEVELKASEKEFSISTKEVEVNVHEGDFHGSHIVKLTYQFVHQVNG